MKRPGMTTVMDYLRSVEKPTIIDIGAYIGKITRLALEANRVTVSYAIEPDPVNYAVLVENHGANSNVHCHRCVIGNVNGKVPLYVIDRNDQLGSSESNTVFAKVMKHKLDSLGDKANGSQQEVDSMTLDEFMLHHVSQETVDMVKLNCEGGEYLIFDCPQREWLNRTQMVWVSWHAQVKPFTKPEYAEKREAACRTLAESGFKMVDGMDIRREKKHIWQVWKRVVDAQ
jgi:FkbM family methyltransferase